MVIRSFLLPILVMAGFVLAFGQQTVSFKTGTFSLITPVQDERRTDETQYLFYKADHVLTGKERAELQQNGIDILYALHSHLYWVRVRKVVEEKMAGRLFDLPVEYKVGVDFMDRSYSNRFRISIAPGMTMDEIISWANTNEISLLDTRAAGYGFIDVETHADSIAQLVSTPWVSFISNIPADEEIQYRAHGGERAWALTSPLTRGLNGVGMTVGIGDGGRLALHDDLKTSIMDLASFDQSNHATQVAGIITGAGLIDPYYGRGYAPKANIIVRNFSDILWDTPQYIEDFNLSLTNNSYGSGLTNCTYFGDYDGTSAGLDAMMSAHPQLLHVFSAANSGTMTCTPYSSGYATIAGGYQPAKNALTVGATSNADGIANFSSRGPVDDGRLKPEVVAYGLGRFSTINNHLYASNSGTSFSSPATTGIAALLYQRYRQLHSDSLPDAALIKNAICNAADDFGNTGPDYVYGFGRINGIRAVEILESGRYAPLEIDQQDTLFRNITIPAGVAFADVMLLWTDVASAPFETVTLVNDLDMVVITPAGDTLKPWKLNYTPSGVSLAAGTGYDHSNNYEQITIPAPVNGMYTIMVTGHNIPLGPQKSWLTWDLNMSGVTVQFPIGNEVFKPGNPTVPNDQQYIRWDAYGTGTSTFTVEYSTNGGSNWNTIASNIPANQRHQGWFPPDMPTDQLKVKVTATNGMQDISDQNAVIMSPPANLNASSPCNGYLQLNWNAVTGADYYQVYTIRNEELIAVDTTSNTTLLLNDFPFDSTVWVSVSGVFPSGKKGLRARAIQVTANGGNNCGWNHDLRLDSLLDLSSGRILTSSALTTAEPIEVRITNGGTQPASGFSLSFIHNNAPAWTEAFPDTINAGEGQNFTFSKLNDLSIPGVHTIKVWVTYASDPFPQNDTITWVIHQFPNLMVNLPWTEDFEGISDTAVISSGIGLPQLDAWDVVLQENARVRTFAGIPFCHTDNRALTVDAIRNSSSKNIDLVITLNMADYNVADDDIRLSLYAMHHEIIPDVTNTEAIWIRGSDTQPFVLLDSIPNEAAARGTWQYLSGLQLSTVLNGAGQEYSSSFQIKFTHGVYATAGQINSQDGQTIDDLSLYRVERDITVDEIIHPQSISCDLGIETIQITVRNTSSLSVDYASAYYQLNGGAVHSTFIGIVPAASVVSVALMPAADFSMTGIHDLKVWVNSAEDDFHFNDTMEMDVLHTALVNIFPYTQGFEQGTGGWFAGGIHSSWTHGSPGKQNMARAAEGEKIWTTALTGTHNADEWSYLYSPCFDLQGMTQPYLSFAFQYQLESNYDYAWVEYRLHGSDDWIKLGTQGTGVNWYNDAQHRWNGNQLKWVTTGNSIPFTDTTIQFRWVMQSDVAVEFEGLALDQVHVYDRMPLYTGGNMQWTLPVSGNEWIHIDQAGQRVFSIHPSGHDLGNVTLNIFKSNNNFHVSDSLYLLSRNWVVTSTIPPSGDIMLRGYFTNDEATNLVNATGCISCIAARDAFDVAALRYTGSNEDGSFSNDTPSGVTSFALDATEIQPYDNGYYAEWITPGLSEWWITTSVTKWSGTLNRKISSTNDDAEEHQDNGSVNPVREVISMTNHEGFQKIGWRFKNITIPRGCYISTARLQWTSSDTSSAPAAWILQSELVADASPFSTSKYNISLRPRSTQAVQWAPVPWSQAETIYSSPDIRHMVQQVIDQPSWNNGNDLVLLMKGNGLREAWSYDGDPLKGAELLITYDSSCLSTGICYVDINANGLQDGSSWTNAYRSLEQALDRASHCPDITAIWITGGTYKPYSEVSRNSGYVVPPGISIYGGFEGNETTIGERIYGAFPTILSGDIGVNGVQADNLYHVLSIQPGVDGVLLDGIKIIEGLANGATLDLQRGSAIYNLGNLTAHQVIIDDSSFPSVYNSPGSSLIADLSLEIRQ